MATDIGWEIEQLSVAIDYYERSINDSFSVLEVEKFEKIVKKLSGRIKTLERKHND